MSDSRIHHLHHCSRCPIAGDNRQHSESYQFLTLRFDIAIARKMVRPTMLHRVDPTALTKWLECTHIVEQHISHLPERLGPGLMVTLPNGCGRLVIDGNHRAARALRRGEEFTAFLLPERETRMLLRESMGRNAADFYWQKMLWS